MTLKQNEKKSWQQYAEKKQAHKTFRDIDDKRLRVWNRCAMLSNIMEDLGEEEALVYLLNFSKAEIEAMERNMLYIKLMGRENAHAEIVREHTYDR